MVGGGAGADDAGAVGAGTEVAVSALLFAGLQPVRRRPAAREVSAANAIVDRLGTARAWFTGLF